MKAESVSANLDKSLAALVRKLAKGEHRTVSNVIANALAVFVGMPKELRDSLLELSVDENSAAFRSVVQEISAVVARRKLDIALQRVAEQNRLPELPEDASDLDILEMASAISRTP
jgi:hypothetical protein